MKDLIKYVMPLAILMVIIFAITNLIEFRFGGLGVGLLIGIIAGYYFNVDNPHNDYKKHITVLLFVWVISIHLSREFNTGTWLPALLSGSLAYYYFFRTRARAEILWVDYLKLIGVILIVPSVYFQSGILAIVALYLGFIFSLDRIVIRRQMNKTTQIITFSIMALMSLSFIIYAFIKADEAEKAMSAHRFA